MRRAGILIVDVHDATRRNLAKALRHKGYEAFEAANGDQALERCKLDQIDLAILDYKMPKASGIQAAETLRDVFQVPFIFLAAYDDPTVSDKAIEHGAYSYLYKPVDIGSLISQVEAALSRAADANNLRRAATETQLINVAIGILMALSEHTRESAWQAFRDSCRARRVKASVAAEEIIDAFEGLVHAQDRLAQATVGVLKVER